ncbi:hypothetical protein [Methanolobus profundi]|uniref:Uncharacterized protein n=1 Tax=Methanolobus profundi TaxID=487685 RepID=A0A1I4PYM0_9EURY|nr:hypothetical protein [Methanolobus profundi]SFM32918.1 hypothetical protein SAMN04488696_0994 [Methanolobus profundi]
MKKRITIILAMILFLLVQLSGFSSGYTMNSTSDNPPEQLQIPDYGQYILNDLENDSSVIAVMGEIPEIKQDEKKEEWLQQLDRCINQSSNKLHLQMKENGGLLLGYGYHIYGYIVIDIDSDQKERVDDDVINDLYMMVNTNWINQSVSNVPVVFRWSITKNDDAIDDSIELNPADSGMMVEEEINQTNNTNLLGGDENTTNETEIDDISSKTTPGFTSLALILCFAILSRSQ